MMGIEPMSKNVLLKQTTSLVYLIFSIGKQKINERLSNLFPGLFSQKLFGKKQKLLS